MIESCLYYLVRGVAGLVRILPISVAIGLGRSVGMIVYFVDVKHKNQAIANLKTAFAETKSPWEIRRITKQLFRNYGQNLIELLRLPLMNQERFKQCVSLEGMDHVQESLKQNKGLILLAMHFGSWEMASLTCSMLDQPYKVIVKPQKRFSKLDELLNSYRECGGSVTIERGMGMREFVKSLKNNEVVGMVVDQGGRDGTLVPFFNRQASMSVGAIRMGLKMEVPICFAIIIREKGFRHRVIVHPPLKLNRSDDPEQDLKSNLEQVVKLMEDYIRQYPSEYMWFYKIWKYSKESTTLILHDGRTGHLRQSQAVSQLIGKALAEREIDSQIKIVDVKYRDSLRKSFLSVLILLFNGYVFQGRLGLLQWFLTPESYQEIISSKADFIVSCGSANAALNFLLANDHEAKSVAILKPGLLGYHRFDLCVLPEHDRPRRIAKSAPVLITKGAANLVTPEYLAEQGDALRKRFTQLRHNGGLRIGLLIGGDTKGYALNERKVSIVIHQLKEIAEEYSAQILVTASRRTTAAIEKILFRELKSFKRCPLLVIPNEKDIPEAFGGILSLSDILVVSGDSLSMICEAASSGKNTIVFAVQEEILRHRQAQKHQKMIDCLSEEGFVLSSQPQGIKDEVTQLIKKKVQLNILNDRDNIFEAIKRII